MPLNLPGQNTRIVVALSLDEIGRHLLRNALELSERTGMAIHLVHVTSHASFVPLADGMDELSRMRFMMDLESHAAQAAEEELKQMIEPYRALPITYRIYPNESGIPFAIISESISMKASIILSGCGERVPRLVPKGFSTVLSLMADSPVPVLVLGPKIRLFQRADEARVLICDDLRHETTAAAQFGILWGEALGGVVRHLHVIEPPHQPIQEKWVEAMQIRAAAGENLERDLKLQVEQARLRMVQRVERVKEALSQKGGSYEASVEVGDPSAAIGAIAKEFQPDTIIFGHHKMVHRKPWGLGDISFNAMLSLDYPIMVVPPAVKVGQN